MNKCRFSDLIWVKPGVFHSLIISRTNKQIKGPDLISSVVFAFGLCCCELAVWSPKSSHCQWTGHRLNDHNAHEWRTKTLAVAKNTIFKKKKNVLWGSRTTRAQKPQKTSVIDARKTQSHLFKNTLKEVDISVSKFSLHHSKHRGLTTRCKPQKQEAQVNFPKTSKGKKAQTVLEQKRTVETKINLYQNDRKWRVLRRERSAHDPKHTSSSYGNVWLPVGLFPLHFLMMGWLEKAAELTPVCVGLNYQLRFRQIIQNSLDLASQCRWTMTRIILWKQHKPFSRRSLCHTYFIVHWNSFLAITQLLRKLE